MSIGTLFVFTAWSRPPTSSELPLRSGRSRPALMRTASSDTAVLFIVASAMRMSSSTSRFTSNRVGAKPIEV